MVSGARGGLARKAAIYAKRKAGMRYDAIAWMFGIGRERVRQIVIQEERWRMQGFRPSTEWWHQ
jgi:hypothetical protein